eukprot:118232-Pyramimonas_sp.AAC.2
MKRAGAHTSKHHSYTARGTLGTNEVRRCRVALLSFACAATVVPTAQGCLVGGSTEQGRSVKVIG